MNQNRTERALGNCVCIKIGIGEVNNFYVGLYVRSFAETRRPYFLFPFSC